MMRGIAKRPRLVGVTAIAELPDVLRHLSALGYFPIDAGLANGSLSP
jgi:hypothetical protein